MEALGLTFEMVVVLGVLALTVALFVSEIVRDQRTEMDLAKAPKAIAHVLAKMVQGDSVRAWLTPALAKEVFPQANSEVVVDVTLLDVR